MSRGPTIDDLCQVRVLTIAGWSDTAIARHTGRPAPTIARWRAVAAERLRPFTRPAKRVSAPIPADLGNLYRIHGGHPDEFAGVSLGTDDLPAADVGDASTQWLSLIRRDILALTSLIRRSHASAVPDAGATAAHQWMAEQCVALLGLHAVADELDVSVRTVTNLVAGVMAFHGEADSGTLDLKRLFAAAIMADDQVYECDVDRCRDLIRQRQRNQASRTAIDQARDEA